jgi:predicted nuclease with TOPRIM domain
MYAKSLLPRFGTLAGVLILGLFAGYICGNRLTRYRYGTELESVRAEQRRVTEQYNELRANYTRARELTDRLRDIVAASTELLQSNDGTISGLRRQTSALREKLQELKSIFSNFDTGGASGGESGNDAVDTITE